jgi:hypothetical protein
MDILAPTHAPLPQVEFPHVMMLQPNLTPINAIDGTQNIFFLVFFGR